MGEQWADTTIPSPLYFSPGHSPPSSMPYYWLIYCLPHRRMSTSLGQRLLSLSFAAGTLQALSKYWLNELMNHRRINESPERLEDLPKVAQQVNRVAAELPHQWSFCSLILGFVG